MVVAECYEGVRMTATADRVTRVASDLFDSAAAEGARQSRSAKQQLDYWARVGREVTFHQSAARSRIESVLAGDQPMSGLASDERLVLNAEIDAEIDLRMATTDFGAALDARGVSTVSLDDQGRLVEHRPDGIHVVAG
jgi:hypothetical protein